MMRVQRIKINNMKIILESAEELTAREVEL